MKKVGKDNFTVGYSQDQISHLVNMNIDSEVTLVVCALT